MARFACFARAAILLCLVGQAAAARGGAAAARASKAPAGKSQFGVTPVGKVIDLLAKLQKQVEEDGKKEATQYDKYSCFCKEQADGKTYAIERSEQKIAALDAEIGDLGTDIAALSAGISALGQQIDGLDSTIANNTAVRDAEHQAYLARDAEVRAAIDATERAIKALKDSKRQQKGHVELESQALAQVRAHAKAAAGLALTEVQRRLLGAQPGNAYEYGYHSNDIISTLQGLRATFMDSKAGFDASEFDQRTFFEKRRLDLQNEKKFAEKEKLEKEKLEAAKTERLEEAQAEKAQETKEKVADESFMEVLKNDCQSKAHEWDQRSQTRAAELTAIAKALEALKSEVDPNWFANRRLVGLQRPGSSVSSGAAPATAAGAAPAKVAAKSPASFLQLRGSSAKADHRSEAPRRLLELLSGAAFRLKSPLLSAALLKVRASVDHFDKVRSIIKDLVRRLQAEALSEANSKAFCDSSMKAAIDTRDAKKELLEQLETAITTKEAAKAELRREIAELSADIAANNKALLEATQLRNEEHEDNTMVVGQAKDGKKAVEFALATLKAFYESEASLLQRGGFVPKDSDREGKTVGDRAPEVFEGRYRGRQEASSGIIGLLEVILSDFDRTETVVGFDETLAASDFGVYKQATEDDTAAKHGQKTSKESEVEQIEDDLVGLANQKRDAQQMLQMAEDGLQSLRSMCVEGEETYEERVAKRQKEIEALKEAHAILQDWQA